MQSARIWTRLLPKWLDFKKPAKVFKISLSCIIYLEINPKSNLTNPFKNIYLL